MPQTIQNILTAGIKLWVLTGDKQETAINIDLNDQVKEIGSGALTAARRDFGVMCGGNKVDGGEMEGNPEGKFDEHNRF